jgi:hypothetical protein
LSAVPESVSPCSNYGLFAQKENIRSMKVTTRLRLVSRLKMHGILPLHLSTPSCCTYGQEKFLCLPLTSMKKEEKIE